MNLKDPAHLNLVILTAQKMKFSIKDFFSKCDQIRSFLSHLLMKSLMKNFIFCAISAHVNINSLGNKFYLPFE